MVGLFQQDRENLRVCDASQPRGDGLPGREGLALYQNRGQLPWLLYSSVFSAAAEAGGLTSENAREYMLSELAVEHGTYHDYANGSLDW